MNNGGGSNSRDMGLKNRMLVLRLIATGRGISRIRLSRETGLSKMTVGNIAAELIAGGVVEEAGDGEAAPDAGYGRRPVGLVLSRRAPCICGMLIKRGLCQAVLAGLDGEIFDRVEYEYHGGIQSGELVAMLSGAFERLRAGTDRRIFAVGIASLGPVNSSTGTILNPPYFYGIENLPIADVIAGVTGVPVFLINDANAGALAEKLYGIGRGAPNFVYLHIMNGIGAGFVLEHKLYDGDTGQSGEIGHTSINFSGPPCMCGNVGCLDLYANHDKLCAHIRQMAALYPSSGVGRMESPTWTDIVDAANGDDFLAISALEEFCGYIAHALINTLNILDISQIIVGYDSRRPGRIVEDILERKAAPAVIYSKYRGLTVRRSAFGGDAPLIGSIAAVAERVFSSQFPNVFP